MSKKGLNSIKTLTASQIAKKHGLPLVLITKQITKGVKVEKEHTKSTREANQIARDHISERPDYYDKLSKMEKTKVSVKEETLTSGVRGLGFVSGDPAAGTNYVDRYINSNAMAYQDENGNKLEYIKKQHANLHNKKLGYNFFNPTEIKSTSNFMKEEKHPLQVNFDKYRKGKLNELGGSGEPDAYIGLSDPAPRTRKKDQLEEGPLKDKAKKIAMAGMTAANMYTMADVAGRATEGGHNHGTSAAHDVVKAASALPGYAGWGAMAANYGKQGYDLARDALKNRASTKKEKQIKEDLRKWFREKWVRYDTKGNIKGPCAREEGEGKPKCRPLASARAMSKDERAKSARRKRREDPVADRPGKGGKPIMVNTNEETLLEKNVPTNPALWARAKAQAKAKFDVYPSAYANGWASKWYKSKGGGWKSAANESVDEACWDGYQAKGMKKKGNKMVPNCVPVEEQGSSATPYTERPTYESAAWQRKAGKNPEGGLNRKGIASYRREHPGSKLSMAVTTEPSKLKPGSKAAKRRKSFCARMGGMPGPMKDEKGRPTRKALSLRKWNCEEETQMKESATIAALAAGSALGAAAAPHINKAVGKGLDWLEKKRKQKHQDHYEKKSRKDVKEDNALPQTTQRGIYEKAPPGAKYERMVRHIKDRLGADGLTDKEKGIAFATAWKAKNKEMNEASADLANQMSDEKRKQKKEYEVPNRSTLAKNTFNKNTREIYTAHKHGKAHEVIGRLSDSHLKMLHKSGTGYQNPEHKSLRSAVNYHAHQEMKGRGLLVKKINVKETTQIDEISAELVGKVSNARFWRGEAPSKTLTRAINKKYAESGEKKSDDKESKKEIKEYANMPTNDYTKPYMTKSLVRTTRTSHEHISKPDTIEEPGRGGHVSPRYPIKEETKMENKELINEAIENILENNLSEMKDNFLSALQEKAQEKLEERKKIIAANYFAQ